jgi:hypothetical protein
MFPSFEGERATFALQEGTFVPLQAKRRSKSARMSENVPDRDRFLAARCKLRGRDSVCARQKVRAWPACR